MNLSTAINAIANGVLAASALHLVFCVFGHAESAIWRKPWAAVLCKAATTLTVCGAIWNLLTLSSPASSEVLLNVGIALNFLWISFYARFTSPDHTSVAGPLSRRNSPRRAANPRKRKKSVAPGGN